MRSYESPTDGLYKNKVHMFNEGGEIDLFKKLEFNAVFYADVLSGSKMPKVLSRYAVQSPDLKNSANGRMKTAK